MVAGIHGEAVGHEHEIELAALGLARDFLDDREIVVADRGAFVSPPGGMVAGAEDEDAEMHLATCCPHCYSTPSFFNFATSSAPIPSHVFSTSAVCWPRRGEGLICAVSPLTRTGHVGILNDPFACSITCMMPRF